MKKLSCMILALVCAVSLAGCGSSSDDYEALRAENEALRAEVKELQEQSTAPGRTVRVSGGFEAHVRHKIPSYLRDGETPEVAVVTRFQDGPMVLNLGAELCAQVEEGGWYYFTIEDQEFEWSTERAPELIAEDVLERGMLLRIRSAVPCEPTGLDSDRLQFTVD